MKNIAMIVPYFGTLPYNFQLWLEGCKHNPTINWLLFIDDHTPYCYPSNVSVTYCSLSEIKLRAQKLFDFPISLDTPYKLCDYRVAYGEIFVSELKKYDFWGYCDIDLMFGNIRKFITEEVLEHYDKIGFQGHLTLLRNSEEANRRYRINVDDVNYKEILTNNQNSFFDEYGIDRIYCYLKLPVWREVYFAHLNVYYADFHLSYKPASEEILNKHQIFTWKSGMLERWYIFDGTVKEEELVYIHFFRRDMKILLNNQHEVTNLLIRPNIIEALSVQDITRDFILKNAHCSAIGYRLGVLYKKKDKLTVKKLLYYIKMQTIYRWRK